MQQETQLPLQEQQQQQPLQEQEQQTKHGSKRKTMSPESTANDETTVTATSSTSPTSSSTDDTGVAVAAAAPTATTSNNNNNSKMQHASKLCGEGRLAWQNNDYTLALRNFGTALRLLQTSLGAHHPLVAKTHYWIGFIYKHLPRFGSSYQGSSAGASSGSGLTNNHNNHHRHQVVLKFMLLSLQEFTNSARIRLQQVSSSSSSSGGGSSGDIGGSSPTLNSKDKESLQAMEWVLKAIQDHTTSSGVEGTGHDGSNNNNPYTVVFSCLDEILSKEEQQQQEKQQQNQRGGETNYQQPSTTWTTMRSLQRLILARPMPPSSSTTGGHEDDSSLFLYPYIASLKKSVELEAKADDALRKGDYTGALKTYVESQTVFPQQPNGSGSVWGKRAFCHHQLSLAGSSSSSSSSSSDRQKQHLQLALHGYRCALKCFYSSSTIVVSEHNHSSNSTHVGVQDGDIGNITNDNPVVLHLEDHPDIRTTMERWKQVYKQYVSSSTLEDANTTNQNNDDHVDHQHQHHHAAGSEISTEQIRMSVKQEQEADEALWNLLWYHQLDNGKPTFGENFSVDAASTLKRLLRPSLLNRAMDRYQGSLELETNFRTTSTKTTTKIGDDGIKLCTVFFNERILADLEQSLGQIRSILSKIEAVDSPSLPKPQEAVKAPRSEKRNGVGGDDAGDLAKKCEHLTETVAKLEAAAKAQTDQASMHSTELDEWKSRYKNLENELSRLKKQLVTTQKEEVKQADQPKPSDSSVDSGSSSPQQIEGMHKQVRAEKDRLAARLRRKHQTPTKQTDASNQAKSHLATIDTLQSQISELKNEIEKLQLDRRDLQSTITTLNDVKKQSDGMVHSLQNEVTTLQNQNEAEMLQLSTKVKKSIQRLHDLEIENFKLQEQIAAKDKLLNEHQEQIEKQREKVHAVAKRQLDKEKHTNHQNERAAKIIHELSAELQNLSEARDQQEQRLARMTDLVLAMESKNRMIKQQKNMARTPYRTTEKVKRLTAKILALQEEAGIDQEQLQGEKSRDSRDAVRRDLFGANTNSGIVQHPAQPVFSEPLPWRLALYIFLKKIISAGKSHKTTFQTDVAVYSIRTNSDKDGLIFDNAVNKGCLKAADQYSDCFRPDIPSSIDVVARLRHDDSVLVLSGDLNVSYISSNGSLLIDGVRNNEDMDGLLGWVDDRISLDQIFEEGCYLREEYSKTQAVASIPLQFPPTSRLFTAVTAFLVALVGSLLVLVRES